MAKSYYGGINMDFKRNDNFFSKYALTICKAVFICLAISVVLAGALAIFNSAAKHSKKSEVASNNNVSSSTSSTEDSSTSIASNKVDPNIQDYVSSSRGNKASNTELDNTDDPQLDTQKTERTNNGETKLIPNTTYENNDKQSKNDDKQDSTNTDNVNNSDTNIGNTTNDTNNSSNSPANSQNNSATNNNNSQNDVNTTDPNNSDTTDQSSDTGSVEPSAKVRSILDSMTLQQKIAQLFFITPEQLTGISCVTQAGDPTKLALEDYPVGGLIYFSSNIDSKDQLKQMLSDTNSYSTIPLFLGVDEEGGSVARIANSDIDVPTFDSMRSIGDSGNLSTAREIGSTIGQYMSELGFNVDFAPVCDVVNDTENSFIGDRSFSSDPDTVASITAAITVGLRYQGIHACLKHFPGLGDCDIDPHTGSATINKTLDKLALTDLVPFAKGISQGVNFIMVGHSTYPNLTGDNMPASMSSYIITDMLRKSLGYKNIIITDALNMGAIADNYDSATAAINAINAGADMLLMPEDFDAAYQGVLSAVNKGTLTTDRIDQSVIRILSVKYD